MKNVLVTGASRGIGLACAERFASAGYNVIINYNKSAVTATQKAEEFSSRYGVKCYAVQADVSVETEVKELFEKTERLIGSPDILINNAGISLVGLFQDTTAEEWDRLFGINLKSIFFCGKEAVSHMIPAGKGSIVNISSMWGQVGASCEAAYSASKAAVIGYTKALAKELAPSGIRVNCVAPGVIETDMNGFLTPQDRTALCEDIPLGRFGSPDEVANCVFFLATDAASYITGQTIAVNGGIVI